MHREDEDDEAKKMAGFDLRCELPSVGDSTAGGGEAASIGGAS